MKTKMISPYGAGPKILPAEMEEKKSPFLIYGIIGGLILVYFLTKKKK
jgi:hypothetical protein